jgi:hypothetical protein
MKIVELINSNLTVAITNEEADILAKFRDQTAIPRRALDEREVIIANQLVNKDLLIRKNTDGKITYFKASGTHQS